VRFIIYGAGGVGSVIGASLFSHGHQTVLVGNPEHVDSIKKDGLRFVTPSGTSRLMVGAFKTAEQVAPFGDGDVILLTAKSQHTVRCLGQLKSAGASRSLPIFCCQNSVWNEPTTSRVFDNVYGVAVSLPATFLRPGEVETPLDGLKGHLEVGRYPIGTDRLAAEVVLCLGDSDFDACLNETVMKAKAAKCQLNLMNPFDAITNTKAPDEFVRHVRDEAGRIWKAAGIEWEPLDEYVKRSRAKRPPDESRSEKWSSTWQSLAKGTGNVEAGQINGDLVTLGRFLGIEAPYNECLWRVCTEMALRHEKPGRYSQSDLERMIAGRSWPAPTPA
jgi:2-dehydropantoate 2-reductase